MSGVSSMGRVHIGRVLAAGISAIALMTAAVAEAYPRAQYKQYFSTKAPGAPARADTEILYRHPDDPKAKSIPVRREVFNYPRGTTFNEAAVPSCDASREQLQLLGEAACPPASRIGGGAGTFMTGYGQGETPMEVDIFAAEGGFFVVGAPKEASALRFVARARREGKIVTVPVPKTPGGPPEGESVLRQVHNFLDARRPGSAAYLRTPSVCPRGGSWLFRARFRFADGIVEKQRHRMPCTR